MPLWYSSTLRFKVKMKLNTVCFDILRDGNNMKSATLRENKYNILINFISLYGKKAGIYFQTRHVLAANCRITGLHAHSDIKNCRPRAKTSVIL